MPRTKFPSIEIKPHHPLQRRIVQSTFNFFLIAMSSNNPKLVQDSLILYYIVNWIETVGSKDIQIDKDTLFLNTNLTAKRLSAASSYLRRLGILVATRINKNKDGSFSKENKVVYRTNDLSLTPGEEESIIRSIFQARKKLPGETRFRQALTDMEGYLSGPDKNGSSGYILFNNNKHNNKHVYPELPFSSGPDKNGARNSQARTRTESNSKKKKKSKYTQEHLKLARKFHRIQKNKYPRYFHKKSMKDKNAIIESADTIRKLEQLDGFDMETIEKVILWAVEDKFWSKNIISLRSLRNKSKTNDQIKFLNMLISHDTETKKDEITIVHGFDDKVMGLIYDYLGRTLDNKQMTKLIPAMEIMEDGWKKWPHKDERVHSDFLKFYGVIYEYIDFLKYKNIEKKYRSVNLFNPDHKYYKQFLDLLSERYGGWFR